MKTTKKWNKMVLVGMLGMALNGIVLMGCVSSPSGRTIVYDPEQPEQEQSMIDITNICHTFTFDNTRVDWNEADTVFIPSGSHTLVYNYAQNNGYAISSATGLTITYDFKPGYAYLVDVENNGKFARPVIKERGLLLWKLPPVSDEPTKFEGTWKSKEDTIIFSGNTMVGQSFSGNSKYVFTFTDKTMVQYDIAYGKNKEKLNSVSFSQPKEYKYEFKEDGGLVLGQSVYYKKE
ncbi:hypothetical protein FACS189461_5470 [Spirochaetia bacterium]|nr:hypothetical protein FACS189461_5470 [Spirochaetia bacterium]